MNTAFDTPAKVPEAVVMVPVGAIRSDPSLFQYRSGGNADGEVESHRMDEPQGTMKPLLLYEHEDGRISVVDGHHRLAYAKREQMEALPARVIRERDGITPVDAMVLGAYVNFDQEFGHGERHSEQETLDAARVFHKVHNGQAREVAPPPLTVQKPGQLREAYAAGALSDAAFGYVERGEVMVAAGGKVAGAFGTPSTQVIVLELIKSLPKDMQQNL